MRKVRARGEDVEGPGFPGPLQKTREGSFLSERAWFFLSTVGLCVASQTGPDLQWIGSPPRKLRSSSNPRDLLGVGALQMPLVNSLSHRDRVGPNPACWCSYKEKKKDGPRTESGRARATEAEMGAMSLQAEGHQTELETPRSRREEQGASPGAFRESVARDGLMADFWPPDCDKRVLSFGARPPAVTGSCRQRQLPQASSRNLLHEIFPALAGSSGSFPPLHQIFSPGSPW